jgi:hypothetical protein
MYFEAQSVFYKGQFMYHKNKMSYKSIKFLTIHVQETVNIIFLGENTKSVISAPTYMYVYIRIYFNLIVKKHIK